MSDWEYGGTIYGAPGMAYAIKDKYTLMIGSRDGRLHLHVGEKGGDFRSIILPEEAVKELAHRLNTYLRTGKLIDEMENGGNG